MRAQKGTLDRFYQILDWVYPAFFLVYAVEFYTGMWRLSTIVKFACILLTLFYSGVIISKASRNGSFHNLFSLYYLYCIFSFVWYTVNDIPFDCYLNELYNSIPAMLFVYIGLADNRKDGKFFERYAYFCTVSMLIGVFLYITTPGWYVHRCIEAYESRWFRGTMSEDSMMSSMRFIGLFRDVYETDMYAMVALAISLFLFFHKAKSKGEYLTFLMVVINFVAAILTQQRVAMASSILILLFFIFYSRTNGKARKSRILITGSVLLFVGFSSFLMIKAGDRIDQLTILLEDRMNNMSLSTAYSERSNQHDVILNNLTMPIFGKGAGSGGSTAAFHGLPHVNDGGYWELLYEFGIVGILFFFYVMFKTVVHAYKRRRYCLTELIIVCFVLVAMLGSNTITLGYMLIAPFWYSVGRIWNASLGNNILLNELNKK
jgi:hypothetical protein